MKLKLILAAAIGMAATSSPAMAASPNLKGQYAISGALNCLISGTPFNNLIPTSFTINNSSSLVGTQSFDGKGNSHFEVRSVGITPPPVTNNNTNPPSNPLGGITMNVSDATGDLVYTVDNQGTISMDMAPNTLVHATGTSGSGTNSFTVDHHQLAGLASQDNKTILLSTTQPVMETQVIVPASGPQIIHYRLCHRHFVLTWTGD